jgi:soluble lytic murein transglycosylase-like protein
MKLLQFTALSFLSVLFSSCLAQPTITAAAPELAERDTYESLLKDIVYRSPSTEDENRLEYYSLITGDRNLAELIIRESELNNVDPALAFALAFTESSFDTRAVNRNSSSIDRGVFQLNSRSFPDLTERQFFDPEVNVSLGVAYLRYCLDTGVNEVTALAMYNAGPNRVKSSRTPMMTLKYVDKVLSYRDELAQGVIPEEILSSEIEFPEIKSVKNVTLLMEQTEKIN